jgi:hypothetical protein
MVVDAAFAHALEAVLDGGEEGVAIAERSTCLSIVMAGLDPAIPLRRICALVIGITGSRRFAPAR